MLPHQQASGQTLITTIDVGQFGQAIATTGNSVSDVLVNPITNRIYALNLSNGTVDVFDGNLP